MSDAPAPHQTKQVSEAPTITASTPTPAVEPEHDRLWWWLHDHGLATTRHERAEILRRTMGANSGSDYYDRDGRHLDIEHMPDDELIEYERWLSNQGVYGLPLPPVVGAPTRTSWGWDDTRPYKDAQREIDQAGTHETVNGKLPTRDEAVQLIRRAGGRIERVEWGHGSNSVSPHDQPHINYFTSKGDRATVYVQPWKRK